MFGAGARPRLATRPPIGYGPQIPLGDLNWKLKWPFIISTLIAIVIITFSLAIFALEIASLARTTVKPSYDGTTYGTTASTGVGIWGGFFIFVAGVLILMITFMRRTRLWATIAFFATVIAACFSIIIVGLDAKAIKDGVGISNIVQMLTGSPYFDRKFKILAAQLALAGVAFILFIFFILLYIIVLIIPSKIKSPQQPGIRAPQPPMRAPQSRIRAPQSGIRASLPY